MALMGGLARATRRRVRTQSTYLHGYRGGTYPVLWIPGDYFVESILYRFFWRPFRSFDPLGIRLPRLRGQGFTERYSRLHRPGLTDTGSPAWRSEIRFSGVLELTAHMHRQLLPYRLAANSPIATWLQ